MEEILRLFPDTLREQIKKKINKDWTHLQEIRFRLLRPIELIFDHRVEWIEHIIPNKEDGIYLLNQLSEFSLYRLEDELREGFITIEGGHRVGLSGKVNTLKGSVKAIQHITFFNIRIAKEKIGTANSIIRYLYDRNYKNTLIIGAPLTGKTTLIRDLTRLISSGWNHVGPKKVGVIDERSEIGASIKGIPQHDLGKRTDVLDACPKAEGMMMMIRSMSPEVLVVDEIGNKEDVNALLEAINAGVTILCTIHGQSLSELKKRPSLQSLFEQQVFHRYVLLTNELASGRVKYIYNELEEDILKSKHPSLRSDNAQNTAAFYRQRY